MSLTRFKEFRTFGACSFVNLLVKVTDNLYKFCGIIDRFNMLLRNIASGVGKTAD